MQNEIKKKTVQFEYEVMNVVMKKFQGLNVYI